MSNWTSITPTAVRTAKNTAILDQVQSLASERGEADPLPTIVATVVSRIRAAVSAGNQLDADATKIPNSLEGLALGMIVRKLKDYLEIEQTKFESDQAADDRSYLNRIVDARLKFETPDTAGGSAEMSSPPIVQTVQEGSSGNSREDLKGL